MSALLLLFVCLALGVLAGRFAQPPAGAAQGINWWVLTIALPALVLDQIPRLHFDPSLWFLCAMPWLGFVASWMLFAAYGRWRGWSRGRIGALSLTCGLGNTAFMGYPMIEALRGPQALSLAVFGDQTGTFLALSIGGPIVAALYAGQRPQPKEILRRVLYFPAFIALIVGLVATALGGWPEAVDTILVRLGSTLTPLALFSVGLQFRLHGVGIRAEPLVLGIAWRLLALPLAVYFIGRAAGVGGLPLVVGTLQAAMAPMISAGILAEQFGLEPELANTVLGAGILLSLATVPLCNLLL